MRDHLSWWVISMPSSMPSASAHPTTKPLPHGSIRAPSTPTGRPRAVAQKAIAQVAQNGPAPYPSRPSSAWINGLTFDFAT
jgi:hypothetical protein